ncbi:hypothetical protein BDV93DRAFT_610345 [Ceratobasidium sp. AG-I]|nr:hypothetical protein BDV93DRAFT_610345 [Ceratobasidium sp. AG-I]
MPSTLAQSRARPSAHLPASLTLRGNRAPSETTATVSHPTRYSSSHYTSLPIKLFVHRSDTTPPSEKYDARPVSPLPTETVHRILRHLPSTSLPAVCLTSTRFRDVAEPVLYRDPNALSPARVLGLLKTLLRRPGLMRYVRALTFHLDGPDAAPGLGTIYLPALLRLLAWVLVHPNLENLRDLAFCARGDTAWALPSPLSPPSSPTSASLPTSSPSESDEPPATPLPNLTHFSTTSSSTPYLSSFLTSHPTLTHLTLHSHAMGLRLPPHALPQLTHLACAAPALAYIPSRRLAHVALLDAPFIPLLGTAYISVLSEAGAHTNSGSGSHTASASREGDRDEEREGVRSVELRLGHVVITPAQAPLILEPFAQHVPALSRLGIIAGPSFFQQPVLESLISPLSGFTDLSALHMECNAESGCDPLSEEETNGIVKRWREACPSLGRVRLPWCVMEAGEMG